MCRKQMGDSLGSQSNDLSRRTTELVHNFRLQGELTSAQERSLTSVSYGLDGYIASGILLAQTISTCLRCAIIKKSYKKTISIFCD